MKHTMIKIAVAAGLGLAAATSAGYASGCKDKDAQKTSMMTDIEQGTSHLAKSTWDETKKVGNTVAASPSIAYHTVRGDRKLFPETASTSTTSTRSHHESVALTGHPANARKDVKPQSMQSQPSGHTEVPPI